MRWKYPPPSKSQQMSPTDVYERQFCRPHGFKLRIVMRWGDICNELIQAQCVESGGRMPQLRDTELRLYLFGVKDLRPVITEQDAPPVGARRGSGGVWTLDTLPPFPVLSSPSLASDLSLILRASVRRSMSGCIALEYYLAYYRRSKP